MNDLEASIRALKTERRRALARLQYLSRAVERCETLRETATHDATATFFDDLLSRITPCQLELVMVLQWLDEELEKIDWGTTTAHALNDAQGREALLKYITWDTGLSVKNMQTSITGYDELIRVLKNVEGLEGYTKHSDDDLDDRTAPSDS